jgi:hypothetical protein
MEKQLEKRLLVKAKRRLKGGYNSKINLRALGCGIEKWMEVAWDRVQRLGLVLALSKFWAPLQDMQL